MIVAIAGSTGLTGRMALDQLLKNKDVSRVISIGRRTVGTQHDKLEEVFLKDGKLLEDVVADAFICCLGTTIKKARSEEKFLEVDLKLPVHLAERLSSLGCRRAAVVSSLGADPNSRILYTRTKGEMEEMMKMIGFESLTLLRPSVIHGPREESRLAEQLTLSVLKTLSPILQGPLKKLKPTPAMVIAQHLVAAVIEGQKGVHTYTPFSK